MEFLLYNKMDNSRSNIDEKPSFAQIQSTVEMGSLEDRAVLEMEHKSLVNPGSIAVKKSSFKLADGSSDVSSSRNAYVTRSCNGVIGSIKVVVFPTKLNILIIFGPVAIIVDKTSGAHGWVFLLSLLGIIPQAENLGFATDFFGGIVLLCQVLIAISIVSMIAFACVDPPPPEGEDENKNEEKEKRQVEIDMGAIGEAAGHAVGCCGCGGGGGGGGGCGGCGGD